MTRLPAWAESYIGLRFKEKGRDRDGVDCFGLVRLILAEQAGLRLDSFAGLYARTRDGAAVQAAIDAEAFSQSWLKIPAGEERLFDVVRMKGAARADGGDWELYDMHVGLVLAPGATIHVERGIDSALAFYRERDTAWRLSGFFRHASLSPDGEPPVRRRRASRLGQPSPSGGPAGAVDAA